MSTDPRNLLRRLSEHDPRGATWCAVLCAQSVQHLVPAGEHRPATALRLAALWAQGMPVSGDRLWMAASATDAAYETAASMAVSFAAESAYFAAISAAQNIDPSLGMITESLAAQYAAEAARDAQNDPIEAFAELAQLVAHQLCAIDPSGGSHPLWDWVAERHPKAVRIGSLGDALARARRWRLRWHVPHERAIAERLVELPKWWANRATMRREAA